MRKLYNLYELIIYKAYSYNYKAYMNEFIAIKSIVFLMNFDINLLAVKCPVRDN